MRIFLTTLMLISLIVSLSLPAVAAGSSKQGTSATASNLIYQANFDDELPGRYPRHWGKSWGAHKEAHNVYISNIESISKDNCLVIKAGPRDMAAGMFSVNTRLKDVPDGWACYSFCFKLKGSGTDMKLSFRILGNRKLLGGRSLTFGGKRVHFSKKYVGEWDADVWYRVFIWIPTKGGGQKEVHVKLERQLPDHSWQAVGPQLALPCKPVEKHSHMEFIVCGHNFTAFIDDVTVTQTDSVN